MAAARLDCARGERGGANTAAGDRVDEPTLGEVILKGDLMGDLGAWFWFLFEVDFLLDGDKNAALFSFAMLFSLPDAFPTIGGNNRVATGSFLGEVVVRLAVELRSALLVELVITRFLPGVFMSSDMTGL